MTEDTALIFSVFIEISCVSGTVLGTHASAWAGFCGMREQMTLNVARWELARELVWQRESRAGFRQRKRRLPAVAVVMGVMGWREGTAGRLQGTERVWLLVGGGRRGTSRQERKVDTSKHLGVGYRESGDGGGRRGVRGL